MRTLSIVTSLALLLAPALGRADDAPPAGAPPPPAADPARAILVHVPPNQAAADAPVELVAAVDGAWREDDLVARWRRRGDTAWQTAPFEEAPDGGWRATIPGDGVGDRGVEYYIDGRSLHFASAASPHAVPVVPGRLDQLAELDRARDGGRDDEVAADVLGHQFGNRYGAKDEFTRVDLHWTHRFYAALYATTFGFAGIEGTTPDGPGADAGHLSPRSRFGYGGVTLRARPGVFVDARVALAVSHDGFTGGVAGAVTLGRPWASNLSFGGEYLGDLGLTGYVRMQWDTALPVLMGATIESTSLPGSVLSIRGSIVRYDVAYRVTPPLTVRAAVSAGSRDGGPHLGGGLGVSYEF